MFSFFLKSLELIKIEIINIQQYYWKIALLNLEPLNTLQKKKTIRIWVILEILS